MGSAPKAKPTTKVALIGLTPATAQVFSNSFRHFSIEPVIFEKGTRASAQDFRACVVQLGPNSRTLVQRLRSSAAHSAILGVCSEPADMPRYARLGLTALVAEPLDNATVERIVKGTQLLIVGELRKHVRIPIVLEAEFRSEAGQSFTGVTREISCGGLSLATTAEISPDHEGELTVRMPSRQKIKIRATVIWRLHPDLLGFKFSSDDPQREVIRKWIDEYLELE